MSFPRYPRYKDSGVEWLGEVPEHWEITPCRAIVVEKTVKNEGAACEDYLSLMANIGVIPYAEKGDVGNKAPEDLSKCKLVAVGDIVINSMNYGIGSFGLSSLDGVCSPVYIVLRPINSIIETRFALRIFADRAFQTFAQSFGNGILAHRAAISWDMIKAIAVPVPPRDEQMAILTVLDHEISKIDALIEEQQRLIELLKEKRQAMISQAVTKGLDPNVPMKDSGVEWLGLVPDNWEVVRLRFISDIDTGSFDTVDATEDGEFPFFVRSETIERLDHYTHDCEAVFTSGDGAGVGKIFHHYKGKFAAHQRVYVFSNFRRVTGAFFHLYLSSNFYKVALEGGAKSTVDSLRRPLIANFWITVPSLEEQIQVVANARKLSNEYHELIAQSIIAVELLKERRSALISAAVTGKIDVRGFVPAQPGSVAP